MSSGLVTVSHPLAAQVGASILRAGGNAVDAAAAIQFALSVVEPLASGLGGGAFILLHLAAGDTLILDGRERAPAAATPDQFLGPEGKPIDWEARCANGLAVGVPGTVRLMAEAVDGWGRLPFSRVLEPSIELAESGLPVSAFLARRLEQNVWKLRQDPASAAIFLPGGRPLRTGDRLVQPDLARTLRLLADGGPDVFYRGEIGDAIIRAVKDRGGRLSAADLETYEIVQREPLVGSFRGYEVRTMPPPGAGVILLQMLGLLELRDLSALGPLSAARAHLELQAMRLALVDRAAYLADPAFSTVPVAELRSSAYLARRADSITAGRLGSAPSAGAPATINPGGVPADLPEAGQTTHFVVLDGWGNLACCTSTLEDFFGSGITVPGYGLLLNNEVTDFDPHPGHLNQIRPFARPASSMSPTLLLRDGRPRIALGSPGGPTIVTAVLQVLLRVIDDGLPLQAAVDAPRFFASGYPRLTWEKGLPAETLAGLARLGHQPSTNPTTIGSVQAVLFDPESGEPIGAADPRRDGTVIVVD